MPTTPSTDDSIHFGLEMLAAWVPYLKEQITYYERAQARVTAPSSGLASLLRRKPKAALIPSDLIQTAAPAASSPETPPSDPTP